MNLGMHLFRVQNRVLSVLSPQTVVAKAASLFFTPRRHQIKNWEHTAESSGTRINLGNGISAIRWGSGIPILMMHGWEGRATQMAGFVEPLTELGYEIIALDAPAHGKSEGTRANPMKFIQAMRQAENVFGPFYAVVGHSMGAGCALYCAATNFKAEKVIAISGPANFQTVSRRFASFIGLNRNAEDRFIQRVEETVGLPFEQINLAKKAGTIPIPCLLIHDDSDEEIPLSDAHQLLDRLPKGYLYETTGLGHRKIMRDKLVIDTVTKFIHGDATQFAWEVV